MSDFEVASYNVNGLGDDRKRRKIFNYMKNTLLASQLYFYRKLIQPKRSKSYLNTSGEVKCFLVMVPLVVKGFVSVLGTT